MCEALGFDRIASSSVALAVTELGTNLVRYARNGRMTLQEADGARGVGIEVESRDDGPGITDLDLALTDGYSTGAGLGSGLPAARRLMDEFSISSDPRGTVVWVRKWKITR
jgi:serine/threonine-protein kinase RsbT